MTRAGDIRAGVPTGTRARRRTERHRHFRPHAGGDSAGSRGPSRAPPATRPVRRCAAGVGGREARRLLVDAPVLACTRVAWTSRGGAKTRIVRGAGARRWTSSPSPYRARARAMQAAGPASVPAPVARADGRTSPASALPELRARSRDDPSDARATRRLRTGVRPPRRPR